MATAVQPVAAPAAPAPVSDTSQVGVFGMDNALDTIAREAIQKTLAEQAPADKPVRDEKTGQFVAKNADGQNAPAEKGPAVPPVPDAGLAAPAAITSANAPVVAEDEPAPLELPEGFVLAPTVEGRELKTQFKVLDPDGAELEIPELKISFKANGKDRTATLDHVVKMAEWGVFNQERHEQMERTAQDAQVVRQQYDNVVAYARQLESEREQLLGDDNFYLRTRAHFESQNTPEARNQREREQIAQDRARMEVQQVNQAGTQFYTSELLPAINTITKTLPLVSDEEIGAKLLLISDRFKVQTQWGAVIPPNQYDAIRSAILSDVVPWAQQLNDHREHERTSATKEHATKAKQAEAKARTAQIDAQKAKSLVGRVTRPAARGAGGPVPSLRDKPAPTPIRNVEEAEQSAIRDALAATLGSG